MDFEKLKEILFNETYKLENKHIDATNQLACMYTDAGRMCISGGYVSLRSVIEEAGLSEEYAKYRKERGRHE